MFIFILLCSFRLYSKDSIKLQEVLIEKKIKKAKIRSVHVGTNDLKYSDNILFFTNEPVFYLTDNLPDGYIQQIELFFVETAIDPKIGGRDYKTFKIYKTDYEVTLYEVKDNYDVGKKVNEEPINIVLEETSNDRIVKVKLNFASYNFKAKRFYIELKKITETTCEKCYFHAPVLYKTNDGYHFIKGDINKIYIKSDSDPRCCYGLQMKIETLTQEY